MLKQVYTFDSCNNDIPTIRPSIESLIRKTPSCTMTQTCESKHNLFTGSYQHQDKMYKNIRKDRGDEAIIEENNPSRQFVNQSQACGDFFDKSFRPINSVQSSKKSDITIRYKNVCFEESEASSSNSSNEYDITDLIEHRNNIVTRPIFCPITRCAKVLTPDSILQHFCFEHSKVPKIQLEIKKSHYMIISTSNLRPEIVCLAMFLKQDGKRSTKLHKAYSTPSIASLCRYDNIDPLFLMASKISITKKIPADGSKQSNGNIEILDDFLELQKNEKINICNIKRKSNQNDCKEALLFNEDEVLLLWVSEVNYLPKTYKITVSSDNRKYSHSYTGNSIQIKDKNDAFSIYKRGECLAVNGTAVNKLLNAEMSMKVILKAIY
ncbi:hypothetical protein K1T71_004368 [Dendrolimus kikuchii]|uniref:Uncharacterized protein n=1 Tax=Dendrolimus kikuchii TaxID=765133 RepID=A0ACC1D7E7_9NEOP|nr:hypothetical protein K1T71_004368 [Dendrolimus kikuchii]